jgi:hypothetical protein
MTFRLEKGQAAVQLNLNTSLKPDIHNPTTSASAPPFAGADFGRKPMGILYGFLHETAYFQKGVEN